MLMQMSLQVSINEPLWFRQQVTMRIDENLFNPLFCHNNGTPNAPIRVFKLLT